jgi:hypothetical protein
MQSINRKDVEKLENDPLGFAMMMENHQIEDAIVAFVSVLNRRKPNRGDKN